MKKLIIYYSILTFCFTACKKIIDIDIENATPQIVIEGKITDRLADQQILISKTVGYTEKSVFPKVSGATVNVTDDAGNNYVFVETTPGVYVRRMRGVSGNTYKLSVTAEGKTYTAQSKMPNNVKLDSIGIVTNSFFGNDTKTAAAYLVDPANETNFYHFNLYINDVFSPKIYVTNDRLTNGNKLRIQLYYDGENDDVELKSGDKLSIEMECIDVNTFNYWYALSSQSNRGPNQGTTPSNPVSNISNSALGYFSAHTYQKLSSSLP